MNAHVTPESTAPYEEMSASLLSQQPVTPPEEPKSLKNWQAIYNHLESRLSALRTWRWSWWTFWSVLAAFFLPRRYHWIVTANRMDRGRSINDQIIDSTATLALRTCGAGMWTGLTSPSRPWFKWDKALPWIELDADGAEWLEDTTKRVGTVLASSNFYPIMAQAFPDVALIGTAPVLVFEDAEDIARFYLPCAGEYFLAVSARFEVTDLYREFVMTVKQQVDMFQLVNCSGEVQKAWANGQYDAEFVVAHAIEPNFAIGGTAANKGQSVDVISGRFAYREVYWLRGNKTARPMSVKGFHTKPFAAFRCYEVSNEPYGRSFCMDAIGDTKQVQLETRRKAEFIEKGVRPSMGADVELKNEPASIIPGQITYMNTAGGQHKKFWPLFEVNFGWLTGITADIKEVQARIQRCLYVDVFMAISRMEGVQPRNELELTKRDLERLQELGPVVTLAEKELDVILMRVYDIMSRRNMLKPMPESLKKVPLKISYTSIMRLAQQAAEAVAMKDVFATSGQLSSAAKAAGVPDPIRVINLDKALRHYGQITNFPTDCIFTDDEVAKHDQAREQAKQQAAVPGQAMAAVQAAKTLSNTQVPGGSALDSMLHGSTGLQ